MTSAVELSAGTVEYQDVGTGAPTIVFLHGFLMDASLWDGVINRLRSQHRCVAPTLPLGAHRRAMSPDADLSLPGVARLVVEFLERLDLDDVILVGNDTGGAIVQLVICEGTDRVGRVVLTPCEAFDNMPPGLTGRALGLTGKLPPRAFGVFMQQLRARPLRRLPFTYGWLTKRGDAVTRKWLEPILHRKDIRRDAVRAIRAAMSDRRVMKSAPPYLEKFDGAAIVIWASEDKVMPVDHGRRLAEALPQASFVEVADSYTLIPLDQPAELASLIERFVDA